MLYGIALAYFNHLDSTVTQIRSHIIIKRIYLQRKQYTTGNRMEIYRIEQLLDLGQVRHLLESHHRLSGMAYGLFDPDENNLIAVGGQDICTCFHQSNVANSFRCRESDSFIKTYLLDHVGNLVEFRCKTGLIDVAMPLVVDGMHLATFFTGQFFYDDTPPDRAFFITQAAELGLSSDDYLAALDRVPMFSREHIRNNIQFLHTMVQMMAEMGLKNLRLNQEIESRKTDQAELEDERLLAVAHDITERKRMEEALLFIAQRGWQGSEEPFFDALVRYIGESLCVDYAFIDKIDKDAENAETVAVYARGENVPNMRYPLKGSPCGNVVGQQPRCYPRGVQQLFPEDALLVEMGAESYVGIPLWDSAGRPIGLIAVSDSKPLIDETPCVQLLQLVATRAAAELEREQNTSILRMRELEFRTLAENSPDNIIRYDRDCRVVYFNSTLLKSLEMDCKTLIGRTPIEACPGGKETIGEYETVIRQVLATGEPDEVEIVVTHPDGELRTHQIHVVAEQDDTGYVIGALAVGRDITERKRAEQQLELMRFALDHVEEAAYLLDESACFLYVNEGACRSLGYSRSELLGRLVSDIDPDMPGDAWLNHWQELKKVRSRTFEGRHKTKDGCLFQVEINANYFAFDGNGYNLALVRDVSKRKQAEEALSISEQQFRTLAENSPDPIFRYDRDCRRLYANQAVGRILGKPVEGMIGKTPADGATLASRQSSMLIGAIRQVFETEEPGQIELDYVAADGHHREYQALLIPEHDASGQVMTVLVIGHDITAIRSVEHRLTRFVSNLPGFAYSFRMSTDGQFSFPFASPGIKEILGVSLEDLHDVKLLFYDLLNPDDVLRIDAALIESAWTMTPFREEFRVRNSELADRWIEAYATPEQEQDRSVLWHGIMLDITERKLAEEALRARERQLRILIENIPDQITGFDTEGRVRYFNPAVTRDLGLTIDMVAGLTPIEVSPGISAAENERCFAGVLQAVAEGVPNEIEAVWQTLCGKRLFDIRHIPELDTDGTVIGVLGISRDITERMEMEASLRKSRHMLEEAQRIAHIGSWELDLHTNQLIWSDEVFRMFEVDQCKFGATHETFLQIVHPDDRDMVQRVYAESILNQTPYSLEHRLLFPDGRIKYVQERCETCYSAEGLPLRSMGTVQDITEYRLTEEALQTKQRKVEELEFELAFAEERERQRIATILHDHIGQLLLLARIKLGTLPTGDRAAVVDQTVCDVRTLLDESIQAARELTVQLCPPVLATMGLEPALELLCEQMLAEQGLQVSFCNDHAQKPLHAELRTILYESARELLMNIVKHARANLAQLTISREKGMFQLTVTDNGIGFSPDTLAVTSRHTRSFGLFNVMRRIRNIGGEILIDSSPLQGTQITIRMPLDDLENKP